MNHNIAIITVIVILIIYLCISKKEYFSSKNNRKGNLKMAICFFGLTRSLSYTYPSIKENIFNELDKENIDYDIYIHTYYLENITNPRSGEFNLPLDNEEFKLLNPYKYQIDDQNKFDMNTNYSKYFTKGDMKKINDGYQSFKNLIRALNSKKKLNMLWVNSNKQYDVVLYLRPDLLYDKIDARQFFEMKNKNDTIFIPTWASWNGYNDRIACGTPHVMSEWGMALFDNILQYSQEYSVNSEEYNKYIIEFLGFKVGDLYIIGKRVRSNGKIQEMDENLF